MGNEISDNEYEHASASELSENKLRHNFRLGDITWVKQSGSSWWPAQVIDEGCVGSKPKKKAKHDCLVRLYGTCQYLYIDPWKSITEFKMMLKQQNKSAMEVFREVLEKDVYRVDLSSDYDEEADYSEGTKTKMTTGKTSSRKIRKQEGLKQCTSYKGVKKSATTENLEGDSEKQDQEVGSTATTGTVQKGKRRPGRKSSSSHDTVETIDKDFCDNSAESSRGKRQKRVVQSVVRREGLRRSGRANAKEYLEASEDITASFTDTDAGEDAEDSMVHETSAPHTEIKAMVRDILFKEIIDREHDAEMAYVDEVINGICNTTVDNMTSGATGSTSAKGGQGIKRNGTGVAGESTQERRKSDQTTEVTKNDHSNSLKDVIDATPSRDAVMKEQGQLSARQIRQIRIMQSLGLIAPSGSPFGKNTLIHKQ